jgi:DNA-binding transcriptional regulator YiaG
MNHPHRSARWRMTPDQLLAEIDELTDGNQSEFARMIGVDGRTVRYWVAGTARVPKPVQVLIRTLKSLSKDQRDTFRDPS